eukprot:TRINITY_DN30054_c0_g1_i1.p1 TRINITY_DN30054_c0_g1~~TRINITY_DN30054_c0_g1_i1.p1  ORF type:complete len:667 (+),score=122.26 TRINITY_DN30054_c0_g1_i1:61-2061(+)
MWQALEKPATPSASSPNPPTPTAFVNSAIRLVALSPQDGSMSPRPDCYADDIGKDEAVVNIQCSSMITDAGNDEMDDMLLKQLNQTEKPRAVFQDVDDMKKKIREGLLKKKYNVHDYYKTTGVWQRIARSTLFDSVTLSVIGVNALWMWVDTDLNNETTWLSAHPVFQAMENFFCVYFAGEWFIRYMAFSRLINGLRDPWFVFDTLLVTMMVLETWVIALVMVAMGGGAGAGLGDASILRLVRLLRLTRMARMARLLRALPELLIMLKGIVSATRSVFLTLGLLAIILYIFGIAFRQLTEDTRVGKRHFGTVLESMKTLLLYGTLLDNVGSMVDQLGSDVPMTVPVFFMFVLLAALTVMNMLIGVLCEVVGAVAVREKEEMTCTFVKDRLQTILHASGLDHNGDGLISRSEFEKMLGNQLASRTLFEVGVDPVGLIDLADLIFADDNEEVTIDEAGQKALTFGAFMDVVLQLRGTNNATVKDVMDMRKYLRKLQESIGSNLEMKLDSICRHIGLSITTVQDSNTPLQRKTRQTAKSVFGGAEQKTDARVSQNGNLHFELWLTSAERTLLQGKAKVIRQFRAADGEQSAIIQHRQTCLPFMAEANSGNELLGEPGVVRNLHGSRHLRAAPCSEGQELREAFSEALQAMQSLRAKYLLYKMVNSSDPS